MSRPTSARCSCTTSAPFWTRSSGGCSRQASAARALHALARTHPSRPPARERGHKLTKALLLPPTPPPATQLWEPSRFTYDVSDAVARAPQRAQEAAPPSPAAFTQFAVAGASPLAQRRTSRRVREQQQSQSTAAPSPSPAAMTGGALPTADLSPAPPCDGAEAEAAAAAPAAEERRAAKRQAVLPLAAFALEAKDPVAAAAAEPERRGGRRPPQRSLLSFGFRHQQLQHEIEGQGAMDVEEEEEAGLQPLEEDQQSGAEVQPAVSEGEQAGGEEPEAAGEPAASAELPAADEEQPAAGEPAADEELAAASEQPAAAMPQPLVEQAPEQQAGQAAGSDDDDAMYELTDDEGWAPAWAGTGAGSQQGHQQAETAAETAAPFATSASGEATVATDLAGMRARLLAAAQREAAEAAGTGTKRRSRFAAASLAAPGTSSGMTREQAEAVAGVPVGLAATASKTWGSRGRPARCWPPPLPSPRYLTRSPCCCCCCRARAAARLCQV